MAANENQDDSLYPIAVLIDELRNEDVQVDGKNSYIFSVLWPIRGSIYREAYEYARPFV